MMADTTIISPGPSQGDGSATSASTSSLYEQALEHALASLGYERYKPAQKQTLVHFLDGKDVFVSLPTGYGKSIIYEVAPLCTDFLRSTTGKSLAVVVSPLVSLMEDQKARIEAHGINVVYLGKQDIKSVSSSTSIVLASPETLLGPQGKKVFARHGERVCGLFVDESHCIALWDQADTEGKLGAFREHYGQISELRSLLHSSVPLVSLTATATQKTRNIIVKSLCMSNIEYVTEFPDRPNIRYSYLNIREPDSDNIFHWLAEELQTKGKDTDRVIVYCGSRRQCSELYAYFEEEIPDNTELFAMYHRMTSTEEKTRIVQSLTDPSGEVRVLFATIAFGMGVDAKAVHSVIHFFLTKSEECYFQESGRAGRDGLQSYAVLVQHPKWRAGRVKVDESMKKYASESFSSCRRKYLLGTFGVQNHKPLTLHQCCDVCARSCLCGGDACMDPSSGRGKAEIEMSKVAATASAKSSKLVNVRNVEPEFCNMLRERLTTYRQSLLIEDGSVAGALYTGGDVASAFPMEYINGIVSDATKIADIDQLQQLYPLFNEEHKVEVWKIFTETIVTNSSQELLNLELSQLTLGTSSSSSVSEQSSASDKDSIEDVHRGIMIIPSENDSSSAKSASSSDSD